MRGGVVTGHIRKETAINRSIAADFHLLRNGVNARSPAVGDIFEVSVNSRAEYLVVPITHVRVSACGDLRHRGISTL